MEFKMKVDLTLDADSVDDAAEIIRRLFEVDPTAGYSIRWINGETTIVPDLHGTIEGSGVN